jgi:Fis family transcriptional regulator
MSLLSSQEKGSALQRKREDQTPDEVIEVLRAVIGTLISTLAESKDKKLYELLMSSLDHALIQYALEMEGNQVGAAELLGISRTTLRKKIKEYNLGPIEGPRNSRRSS